MESTAKVACWEIMGCDRKETCPAWLHAPSPCWKIVRQMDDYRSAMDVCVDCVVYVLNHDATVFSKHEIECIKSRNKLCAAPSACRLQPIA